MTMRVSTAPTAGELEALAQYREAAGRLAEAWSDWLAIPDTNYSEDMLDAMGTIVEIDGFVVVEPDA